MCGLSARRASAKNGAAHRFGLKDKVEQQDVSAPAGSAAPVSPVVGDAQREAQAALQALGYTSAEAARAINLVRDQADTVDALIMLALRQIGSL
ncbi:MAG: hypothetical protein ACLUI3_13720 [Christensenellales bacterium]